MKINTPVPVTIEQVRNHDYDSVAFFPEEGVIPDSFLTDGLEWLLVASDMMWLGSVTVTCAVPKEGIETNAALLHVGAVLHADGVPIETRERAAAYLLMKWFDEVRTLPGNVATAFSGVQ